MAKRKSTPAEKNHMKLVASLGCFINNKDCFPKPEVHHRLKVGKKASDFETMCLCYNHHSAQTFLKFGHAVHKGTKSFEENYFTQDYMLEQTLVQLKDKFNYEPPEVHDA